MSEWWKQNEPPKGEAAAKRRAVAYYRHSAEIGQENSVEIQQDNIRAFAAKHEIEIIHEFADHGKSGLNAEGRPAFTKMMELVKNQNDFDYVLVLDVSRWGRFQDIDMSAFYKSQCTQNGKQLLYTNIGFTKGDDALINSLRESIDRYQAAETSRVLSKKVFEGCMKVARQGYRPGGPPPYAFHRMMLDERKQPDRILQPGQRKAIQNGRVILVPGDQAHVTVVQEIFVLFVEKGLDERQIAGVINQRGVLSPGGRNWSDAAIRHVLTNQQYAGAVVYNKTRKKLKSKVRRNPKDQWVVTQNAYNPIVTAEMFERAQSILDSRKRCYDREELLRRLRLLYEKYAIVTSRLIQLDPDAASSSVYAKRFCSINGAFQAMFADALKRAKNHVATEISRVAKLIDEHEDFLVVNRNFTVLIQPSVPTTHGYDTYWEFRPDHRTAVDITLGVPLSNGEQYEILGYLVLPRLTVPGRALRLASSNEAVIEMHGYRGLELIKELMG